MSNATEYKNPSREYLISLSPTERNKLAERVGVSGHYIYLIGKGYKTGSRELNLKLESATDGIFKDEDFTEEIRQEIHKHGGPL